MTDWHEKYQEEFGKYSNIRIFKKPIYRSWKRHYEKTVADLGKVDFFRFLMMIYWSGDIKTSFFRNTKVTLLGKSPEWVRTNLFLLKSDFETFQWKNVTHLKPGGWTPHELLTELSIDQYSTYIRRENQFINGVILKGDCLYPNYMITI